MSAIGMAYEMVMTSVVLEDLLFDGEPEAVYKSYAKLLHPDMVAPSDRERATEAFAHLQTMWDVYNGKDVKASGPLVISTQKRDYVVGKEVAQGHFSKLYSAFYQEGGASHRVLLKMPMSPKDSDLIEREAKAIKLLDKGAPEFRMFTSELVETFRHRDATTKEVRRVNVLKPLDGFYNLAEVADAYPVGVPPKHIAWMWRRLLVAVGQAHEAGLVHGAVVPENIMIHPAMHGVVLIDWCYSCTEDQTIPAIPPGHKLRYPQSVLDKVPPTFALDLAMAGHAMTWLGGVQTPREFLAFARGSAVTNPPKPSELLGEFDELLDRMWGKRKYIEFTMPERTA